MKQPILFAALALALSTAALAQSIEEKAAVCSGCHGEKGVPLDKTIPSIWGQHEGYIYIQMRDYKRGDRKNEIMQAVVAELEKPDMQALAAFFAAKPWTDLQQPRATPEQIGMAETTAASAQCPQCHLGGYLGDSGNPRVAGQGKDYLFATMNDFRTGARANNSWMTALLKTYKDEEIEALAAYLAGL